VTKKAAKLFLCGVGAAPDDEINLAAAALSLASLDRPRVSVDYYEDHLSELSEAIQTRSRGAGKSAQECASILQTVIASEYGYQGDQVTYDDLQNANLMWVIDRRRGLPVALGILYIHVGRTMGWALKGMAFPGHFLVQLDAFGERIIIDPFNNGCQRTAEELRQLLKSTAGAERELRPEDYATVSDRDVLLRLQNNLKFRFMQMRDAAAALQTIDTMLLFAPDHKALWWESGVLNREQGNLQAAARALEEYMSREDNEGNKHRAAAMVQKIRRELN